MKYYADEMKTFRDALLERVSLSGGRAGADGKPSLKAVADGAGVSYEQLKKVKQRGGSTNADDAVKVAHYFGLTYDEFIGDPTATLRSEIDNLHMNLEEQERALLRAYADGLRARRQEQ
jgi:hypothetical protein